MYVPQTFGICDFCNLRAHRPNACKSEKCDRFAVSQCRYTTSLASVTILPKFAISRFLCALSAFNRANSA